jgi:hypothetical protein
MGSSSSPRTAEPPLLPAGSSPPADGVKERAFAEYLRVRQEYLSPPLASRCLSLRETRNAARRLSGDPGDLRLFGLPTAAWYALGVRISGRSAIEATRDPQARFLANAVASTLAENDIALSTVIDPFVGSGNTLYHFLRATKAARAVAIDSDPTVSQLTARNLALLQRWRRLRCELELSVDDWSAACDLMGDAPTLVIVSPPWGDAFGPEGLDLRKTYPPVTDVIEKLAGCRAGGPVFVAIMAVPEMVVESVQEVIGRHRAFPVLRPASRAVATRIDYLLLQIA